MSEEWEGVKSEKPIAEGAQSGPPFICSAQDVQIHDCNFPDNGTSNVSPRGTREEAFTQRIQFFTVFKFFSIVMEQWGHLVMTCPFLLEELQGAATDCLINGIFRRVF